MIFVVGILWEIRLMVPLFYGAILLAIVKVYPNQYSPELIQVEKFT